MKTCQYPDCDSMVEGTTDYCGTHNRELRRKPKTKVVRPVKRVTEKRAAQNREYSAMRKEFLKEYPVCQVKGCSKPATSVHHIKGRSNDLLTDPENFMAICDDCHRTITEHSAEAIRQGYSKLRSV